MRKLSNKMSLANEHEQITATEFRACPGEVFTQISLGKTFTVTKNGSPIAVISKPEPTALELGSAVRKLGLV